MELTIEQLLKNKGLERIESLEQVVDSKSFLVKSFLKERDHFIVYPVIHRKANLCHDLLNLYGVHWRYRVFKNNWDSIEKIDGDTKRVLSQDLKISKKRGAVYAFTKKMINNSKIYWIFKPNTEGWDYYQNLLLPIFNQDMKIYKNKKSLFKKNI
jgi:hypothetical protein